MDRGGTGPSVDQPRRWKAGGAVIAFMAVPVLMIAVSEGLVPQPAVDEPVWWVLAPAAVGYWAAFIVWARES